MSLGEVSLTGGECRDLVCVGGGDEESEEFRRTVDGRHGRRYGIVYVDTNTANQGRPGRGGQESNKGLRGLKQRSQDHPSDSGDRQPRGTR